MHNKTDAQLRADRIQAFAQELHALEGEDVIALSREQHDAISTYHQGLLHELSEQFAIDQTSGEKSLSWGMRIASFLGALALAASIFFLFYRFWGFLSTPLQVGVLIGAALGSLAVTTLVARYDSHGYYTKLAGLVAFACFVLNISMLGQIFNITPSDKALLPWAALALLLAYAFDVRLLLAAAIISLIAFISARVGTWSGMYWIYFGQRPENFIPVALILYTLPMWLSHRRYSGFGAIYRVFGLITLFIPLLILSNWGYGSYLSWDTDFIEGFYQLLGFGLSAAAIWLGLRRGWSDSINTGVTFFVIFLYTKLFDWWWDYLPKYLFFLLLAAIAILCLVVLRRLYRLGRRQNREMAHEA